MLYYIHRHAYKRRYNIMSKDLKKISMKKANAMGLFIFNVLLLVVFIVSIAWGGFAKTRSGITIPNTGLIIPFVIFILFSIVQLIAIKCNNIGWPWA